MSTTQISKAHLRTIIVNQKHYLQVITYEPHPKFHTRQKIKILKAFGPSTPENLIEAQIFICNYNFALELLHHPQFQEPRTNQILQKICVCKMGNIFGVSVITSLFPNAFSSHSPKNAQEWINRTGVE